MPTSAERQLIAAIGAHGRWAKTSAADRQQATSKARQALFDKFAAEVDPDGVLTPKERERRARHAQRAHMSRIALKSAQTRRQRALDAQAATIEQAVAALGTSADEAAA